MRVRYVKYAAAAAAAVVVVSGTVLSMPLWNRVQHSGDGVISETTAFETAAPSESAAQSAAPQPTPAQAAATEQPKPMSAHGGAKEKNSSDSKIGPSQNKTSFAAPVSIPESPAAKSGEPSKFEQTDTVNEAPKQAEDNSAAEAATDGGGVQIMKSVVMGDSDEEVRENKMPADMAPYEEQADVYSAKSAAVQSEIADADIPTPTGYRCTSARPNGYTFVNDDGAVITVTINYGGEERAPYIEENEDNIYAVFTSFGLSVTINASGAERESVEEIINSLR